MRKGIKGADLSVEMDLSPEHELYLQHLAQRQRGQMRLKMSAMRLSALAQPHA